MKVTYSGDKLRELLNKEFEFSIEYNDSFVSTFPVIWRDESELFGKKVILISIYIDGEDDELSLIHI